MKRRHAIRGGQVVVLHGGRLEKNIETNCEDIYNDRQILVDTR
jgi:hypothetical protein